MRKLGLKATGLAGATIALGLLCVSSFKASAQQTLCAVVKLQILQQATLEREAFDAHLEVDNNLPTTPLTNLQVQIFIKDSNGNPADGSFFVKISSLTGTGAVDGTGVVQSSSSANIDWLIIPASGTGGMNPAGQQYAVTALITGVSNGSNQNVTTFPANITVTPQPLIKLEYALPYEVFGQEPLLLPNTITPVIPYPLAVRVTNIGFGPANNFQIQSAQPQILDNKLGLPVDFTLIGTEVGGQTIPNTLLIPFGTVVPNGVSQAAWVMTSSLSGRFISFTSTFTHAADLGGSLTSLLQSVTTYTLLNSVLVDLPGRDSIPDYLVNETQDRGTMQAMLDAGVQPPAQVILESDQPNPLTVTEIPGATSGALSGSNAALTFAFTGAVSSNVWVHSYAPFTYGNTVSITSARRADGKVLNPANVWISKHFVKSTLSYIYWINVLDLTSSTNTYTIQFDPSQLVTPPAAVVDLAAQTASDGGDAVLSFTSPGEGGTTGYLFGGTYLVQAELTSTATFAPGFAQLNITTNTPPGVPQSLADPGLVGNATYYFHIWTENGGGGVATLSDAATAYTLPNPPQNLLLTVGSTGAFASWTIGNNSLPINYELYATTGPGGVSVSSTPSFDSFTSSFTFAGLLPDATMQFYGYGLNPNTRVAGPPALLASTITFAAAPLPLAFTVVSSNTVRANWGTDGNPFDTQYQAELSTSPARDVLFESSLLSPATAFLFTGLAENTTYYGRVRSLGRNGSYSAYADLGPVSFSNEIVHVAAHVGGGLGLGLDASNLLWSVSNDTATVTLAHNDVNGVFTASTTLSGADPAFPWAVFFDSSANTYAVGAALGSNGADLLAIYKATPAGDGVVSSQTYDSGFANNNLVYAAAQPGWIVGSVQTSGPIGQNQTGARSYSLAIWRFNPAAGQVQLTASFTRAGFDVATGLAVDAAGDLWVAGFSQSPNPRSPRSFDLALWKYASDGHTLLAGPFIQEGYLSDYDSSLVAQVALSSGTVFVAAPRGHDEGGTDEALVAFSAATGQVLNQNAWRPGDGSSAQPAALFPDGAGHLVAAGGFEYSDGSLAGIWRYGLDGSFQSAAQAEAGGARGAVINGMNLWLSVDGSSSPYLDNSEMSATGAVSDVEPPRTGLAISTPNYVSTQTYVGSETPLGFIVADDAFAPGDGLGVGATQTFYAVDSSSYALYASSFQIVAEGTHTITFYSLDLEGNAEAPKSSGVAVDATPPISSLQVEGSSMTDASGDILIASGTEIALSAVDPVSSGVASGVSAIYYVIDADPLSPDCAAAPYDPDQPPGSCANDYYDGPFALSVGTHTVYFFSEDNVGNQEVTENVSSITVQSGQALAWTGAAGDSQWNTAGNWDGGQVPGFLNDVAIDANGTIDAAGATIYFRNLTLGDAAGSDSPLLVVSAPLISSGSVTIDNGAVLQQASLTQLSIGGGLTVNSGGLLTHASNGAVFASELNVRVAGDMILSSGAAINLVGFGYGSGQGPGAGAGCSYGPAGGGHGGQGGQGGGGCQVIGPAYDSLNSPTLPGSGGTPTQFGGPGGTGGGVLLLSVGGTLTCNGLIDASGGASQANFSGSGGGAGGSINITAANIAGAGTVQANGGAVSHSGGGGGGGRIAVTAFVADSSNFDYQASGGVAAVGQSGGGGTIYVKKPGQANFNLYVGGSAVVPQPQGLTPISFPLVVDTFTVAYAAIQSTTTLQPITVNSSMTLSGVYGLTVATLTFPTSGMTAFTIPVGSLISAAGMSFLPNWSWTVNGGLNLSSLTAANMAFSGTVNISTLTLTGSTSVNIPSGASLTAGQLTVPPGLAWTVYGFLATGGISAAILTDAGSITVDTLTTSGNLNILSGGLMAPYSGNGVPMVIDVGANFTLSSGAAINLVGQGYGSGQGPGAGAGCSYGPGGGGHGGQGGQGGGGCPVIGSAYDSLSSPTLPGSGGTPTIWGPGGAGGGALLLSVGGTLTCNGLIDASGGASQASGSGSGGGAGGSINVTAANIAGAGTVQANGGAVSQSGGGGGGGRIAVMSSVSDSSNFNYQASGGAGAFGQSGGGGTTYVKGPGEANFNLYVGGSAVVPQPQGLTPISFPLVVDTFAIADAVVQSSGPPQPLIVRSSMTISPYSELSVSTLTLPSPGFASLTIPAGSTVAASLVLSRAASTETVNGYPELVYIAPYANTAAFVSTTSSAGVLALAAAQSQGLSVISGLYDLGPENTAFNPSAAIIFAYNPAQLASTGISTGTLGIYDYDVSQSTWIFLGSTINAANDTIKANAATLSSIVSVLGRPSAPAAPTLSSISVVPSSAALTVGATQYFAAIGYFTDGSSRSLSGLGAWTPGANTNTARYQAAGAYAAGKFYAISGVTQDAEAYDPVAGTWSLIAAPPVNRGQASAVTLGGLIYVFGGCVNADCNSTTGQTWAYNPSSNAWTQMASMPTPRYAMVAGAINGKIYAAGGDTSGFNLSTALEVYDPVANAWSSLTSAPLARSYAAGGTAGGKLYVLGGTDSGAGQQVDPRTETMVYDPVANAWTQTGPMPQAVALGGSASLYGKIYVYGGSLTGGATSSGTWVFDAGTGAWSAGPFMSAPRELLASGAGGGAVYAAGGNSTTSFEFLPLTSGVAWSSDAPSVATVTAAGVATALSGGSAHVIASSGAVAGEAAVTVSTPIATPPSFSGPQVSQDGINFVSTNTVLTSAAADWARIAVTGAGNGVSTSSGAELSATASTLGLWHFDEKAGTLAHDASANGLNGTLNADASWAPGRIGSGVTTAGATVSNPNEGVTLPLGAYSIINNLSQGTIETWAYLISSNTVSPTSYGFIFTVKQSNGSYTEMLFGVDSQMHLYWQPAPGVGLNSSVTVGLNQWTHLAVTWDGTNVNYYVNGVLRQTIANSAGVPNNTSATCLSIDGGCGDAFARARQTLDEMRILNVAETPAQVAADAAGGPAYAAQYTTNGGASWTPLASSSVTLALAPGGSAPNGPYLLTASGLSLANSLTSNQVAFTAADDAGNTGTDSFPIQVQLSSDVTPPVTTISFSSPSFVSSGTVIAIGMTSSLTLTAVDVSSGGVPASGVAATYYAIDAATPTSTYTVPFMLSSGTHTVFYHSVDVAGNVEATSSTTIAVYAGPFAGSVAPSSGPIGVAVTFAGFNFGARSGTRTQVLFGASTATISSWNDAKVVVKVPDLSTGAYALTMIALQNGTTAATAVGTFTVTAPEIFSIVPSSGPIGITFTLTGQSFGVNGGAAFSQVLFGGSTVTISSWQDTTIVAKVPGFAAPATYPVLVQRTATDGGVSQSNAVSFDVTAMTLASVSPSTGPAGITFTLSGSNFGTRNGGNTQVLIGGTSAQISSWADAAIKAVVPALSTGAYPLMVERVAGTGVAYSNVATFTVTALTLAAPVPSTAPVGAGFALTGSGFGPKDGTNTRLLLGSATTQITTWNDSTIAGTVPTLSTGTYPLWIERESGGTGLESSDTVYLQVVAPTIASISPASGPIGATLTLSGTHFGPRNGASSIALIGGATAPITLWNDTTVQATVPGGLSTGTVAVQLQLVAYDGGSAFSNAVSFMIGSLNLAGISPPSGPIGTAFTIAGSGFGARDGNNTQVLIDGTAATITSWSDASIAGRVPALSSGTYPVVVSRQQGGGFELSSVASFTVVVPQVASIAPSSGPIGTSFTLSGVGFGARDGNNTVVLFNGSTATISSWSDASIVGKIPGGISSGTAAVAVERVAGSGSVLSNATSFLVVVPTISTITPNFGLAGTVVNVYGAGFGAAAGTATHLYVGASTVAFSVWNDADIRWTVPASLADGLYAVTVVRSPTGGSVTSNAANFTVGAVSLGAFTASRAATPLSALPPSYFQGDVTMPFDQGGTIQTPALAAVSIPPDALAQDTEVTLALATSDASDRAASLGAGKLAAAGQPVEFGPEGTQFGAPATIALPYDPALVPAGALNALAVQYYDPIAKSWTALSSSVDPINHVVSAQTNHFSLYQPLIPASAVLSGLDMSFSLKAAYVFPNPVRGVSQVKIRIQPGLADSVEVRVYDMTGRKVYSSSNFVLTNGMLGVDDGNGLGFQLTYDNVWDVSGIGSGVYTYVITARKAGNADIHKTGKIGVVK